MGRGGGEWDLRTKEKGLSEVRNRAVLYDFAYYCKKHKRREREEEMKRVLVGT